MQNPIAQNNIGKECIKCHYKRKATDIAPDYACPQCGIVYKKAEEALQKEKMLVQESGSSVYRKQNISVESPEVSNDISNAKTSLYLIFYRLFHWFSNHCSPVFGDKI